MSVVVVGMDFSELGQHALNEALALAGRRAGAHVHAVHVASGLGPMLRIDLPDDVRTVTATDAEAFVKSVVSKHVADWRSGGGEFAGEVETHVRVGAPSDEIVKLAAEVGADMIVVGTHGRKGVTRLILGSVAEAVVRKAGCPVLVARHKQHAPGEPPESE